MCGCLILVTTNNKNFSTLVVICEYCYYCYRDRDHFCRHFRWSFLLPKSTRDNNHESIRDGNFMQEILWNKRNGVVPIFSCWKKISTQKKKKKASTRSSKHTLFLLNFFVLFWFPFPFPFGFWVPIKICKTKLCTNLSTKTHIENKLLKKKQKKKQK